MRGSESGAVSGSTDLDHSLIIQDSPCFASPHACDDGWRYPGKETAPLAALPLRCPLGASAPDIAPGDAGRERRDSADASVQLLIRPVCSTALDSTGLLDAHAAEAVASHRSKASPARRHSRVGQLTRRCCAFGLPRRVLRRVPGVVMWALVALLKASHLLSLFRCTSLKWCGEREKGVKGACPSSKCDRRAHRVCEWIHFARLDVLPRCRLALCGRCEDVRLSPFTALRDESTNKAQLEGDCHRRTIRLCARRDCVVGYWILTIFLAAVLQLLLFVAVWALVLLHHDRDTAMGVRLGVLSPFSTSLGSAEGFRKGGVGNDTSTVGRGQQTSVSRRLPREPQPSLTTLFLDMGWAKRALTRMLAVALRLFAGVREEPSGAPRLIPKEIRDKEQRRSGTQELESFFRKLGGPVEKARDLRELLRSSSWRGGQDWVQAPVQEAIRRCAGDDLFDRSRETSEKSSVMRGKPLTISTRGVPLPPQCVWFRETRQQCADASAITGVGAGIGSGVQHRNEQRRVRVSDVEAAYLYYNSTPALAAEDAAGWAAQGVAGVKTAAEERFRPTLRPSESSNRRASPLSGVILILAGSGGPAPGERIRLFEDSTLPLIERHFLSRYPHYPIHIFYEANDAVLQGSAFGDGVVKPRAWTMTDALRHSDVYTVWGRSRRSTAQDGGGAAGTWAVRVPPPPPVLVRSADMLPAMRRAHAKLAGWFARVSAAVPSAPYVTFENVASLFSLLPCGVTEHIVQQWVNNPRVVPAHGRGYRQMCRFWARLVWRLPSLRVWTDSPEGRAELAAYGATGGTVEGVSMPPWRYRYSYYWRLDTDSRLTKPLACDPFVTMAHQRCAYGYRIIQVDPVYVTRTLGVALWEWMENRTELPHGVSHKPRRSGDNGGGGDTGKWGKLADPSNEGFVTLVQRRAASLPPTWPWHGVFPEHSSAALTAAERGVLQAYFFTSGDGVGASGQGVRPESDYNRVMYYNNFEIGTFALKLHPLYVSVVDFLDDRDYEDYDGEERDVRHRRTVLRRLSNEESGLAAGDAAEAPPGPGTAMYTNAVYVLEAEGDEPAAVHRSGAGERDEGSVPSCKTDPRVGANRSWRSGSLEYRWGDAPVHTFGVEAVLQREGWGVCAFDVAMGGYIH